MDPRPSTSAPRARKSRADRKQETRDALLMAAIVTFARDGYHGATLEAIAGEAGLSKGAVYSNFDGKAQLFLAVMDYNLRVLRGQGWDPFTAPETGETCTPESGANRDDDAAELVRGVGLATLEFIATAARDDTLLQELRERVQVVLDAYARVAEASRPAGESLPVADIARLMAALDQGTSVLALGGVVSFDGALMRTGLRRLMDPANAANDPPPARDSGTPPLPDVERVQQLLREASGLPHPEPPSV